MSPTQTLRLPVSEPLSFEKRLQALEKAMQELKHELANRYVSSEGDVIEHIRGNYILLVDGISILRSEAYMALSAPQVHLNPEELRAGLPDEIPAKIES